MARVQATNYYENKIASDFHRVTGRNCYTTDIDNISFTSGSITSMYFEYQHTNSERYRTEPVGCVDYKMPGNRLSDQPSAIRFQIDTADRLGIPFYLAVTYLDERFDTKCYYVVPANETARDTFFAKTLKPAKPGCWMSLRAWSRFQHRLRNIEWQPSEPIEDANLQAIGLPTGLTLGELSDATERYTLPEFQFSWWTQ